MKHIDLREIWRGPKSSALTCIWYNLLYTCRLGRIPAIGGPVVEAEQASAHRRNPRDFFSERSVTDGNPVGFDDGPAQIFSLDWDLEQKK